MTVFIHETHVAISIYKCASRYMEIDIDTCIHTHIGKCVCIYIYTYNASLCLVAANSQIQRCILRPSGALAVAEP